MGGMIDAARRSGTLWSDDLVAERYNFMSIPISGPETQFAHDHLNSWSEMTDSCRETLRTGVGGSIPFQQWGTIRQAINEALERIRLLVQLEYPQPAPIMDSNFQPARVCFALQHPPSLINRRWSTAGNVD